MAMPALFTNMSICGGAIGGHPGMGIRAGPSSVERFGGDIAEGWRLERASRWASFKASAARPVARMSWSKNRARMRRLPRLPETAGSSLRPKPPAAPVDEDRFAIKARKTLPRLTSLYSDGLAGHRGITDCNATQS